MGKSQHHAGLHMIQYSKYGIYDDLEYYNEMAIKKHRKEKVKQEEKMKELKEQGLKLNSNQNETEKTKINYVEEDVNSQLQVKQQKSEAERAKQDQELLIDINHFVHLDDVVSYSKDLDGYVNSIVIRMPSKENKSFKFYKLDSSIYTKEDFTIIESDC